MYVIFTISILIAVFITTASPPPQKKNFILKQLDQKIWVQNSQCIVRVIFFLYFFTCFILSLEFLKYFLKFCFYITCLSETVLHKCDCSTIAD